MSYWGFSDSHFSFTDLDMILAKLNKPLSDEANAALSDILTDNEGQSSTRALHDSIEF